MKISKRSIDKCSGFGCACRLAYRPEMIIVGDAIGRPFIQFDPPPPESQVSAMLERQAMQRQMSRSRAMWLNE